MIGTVRRYAPHRRAANARYHAPHIANILSSNAFRGGALLTTALSGLVGVAMLFIKQRPAMRKQSDLVNENLRAALLKRVEKLETASERQHKRHEAERALDRHKVANLNQCFDAVMLMLETSPEKAPEIIAKIKIMQEAQIKAEAVEAAAIHAAVLVADAEDAARELKEAGA